MATRITGPEVLKPGEAQAVLGVARSTLDRLRATGRLPSVRTPGGRHLYRLADVQAELARRSR